MLLGPIMQIFRKTEHLYLFLFGIANAAPPFFQVRSRVTNASRGAPDPVQHRALPGLLHSPLQRTAVPTLAHVAPWYEKCL